MDRARYDRYIARFNAEDPTAFDDYLHPDMEMLNGALAFSGIDGMKAHYCDRIWPFFTEELNVLNYLSQGDLVAVQMWTHFVARADTTDTLFGPVRKGDAFDYRGLLLYELEDGLFRRITVAYNSFTSTPVGRPSRQLGIPH